MNTTFFVTMIETLNLDYGLSLPQSLVAIQLAIRLGQVPLQNLLFEKKIDSSLGHNTQVFRKLIEVDLKRDLKKLRKEDASVTLS